MEQIRQELLGCGASLVGFADLTALDADSRQGFPRAVSVAVALKPEVIAGIADGPSDQYCQEYQWANDKLAALAKEAEELLTRSRHRARAIRPTSHHMDRKKVHALFQHKTASTLAGMGWIGKCALLVTPQFGSAVRLTTILTDAPLATGKPVTESACGDCQACVDVCPGAACTGKNWKQGMRREDFWYPYACMNGMKKVGSGRSNSLMICGMCIAVCPHTQRYLKDGGAI